MDTPLPGTPGTPINGAIHDEVDPVLRGALERYADLAKPASQLSAQQPMGQMGYRVDVNDLSSSLRGEAARRLGIAEQQLKRWMRVYETLKGDDFRDLSVRDLRALIDPNAP